MGSNEQLIKERLTGVGASDIHHVFSLKPYGCARRLAYEKQRIPPDYELPDKDIFDRGRRLEPVMLEMLQERRPDLDIRPSVELYRHDETPEMLCHPDGFAYIITGRDEGGDYLARGRMVVECKTAGVYVYRQMKDSGLPEAYILQGQYSMMVTGDDRVLFCVLWPDGWKFEAFELAADPALQTTIEEAVILFWRAVQRRELPERLEPSDRRCQSCAWRTKCQGEALYAAAGEDTGVVADGSGFPGLKRALDRYWEVKPLADEAAEMIEAAKEEVKKILEHCGTTVEAPGSRVHYKPQTAQRLDVTKVRKKYPKVAEECTVEVKSRPLRIYAK